MSSKLRTISVSRVPWSLPMTKIRSSNHHKHILSKLRTISLFLNDTQLRWKSGKVDLSSIVIPVPITPANNEDDISIGEELSKKINKDEILKIINQFLKQPEIEIQAAENGLDSKLFHRAAFSFRKFCLESKQLPADLHIVFSDILQNAGHVHDIFPCFLHHAREIFPHLKWRKELKKISDLRHPSNCYPEARKLTRKLIFHAGPTNSGKTYEALERFINAKSGVYCSPLKLLSVEAFNYTNEKGTPCDLITGEEKQFALPDDTPANHTACTIEMVSVDKRYEVAVIDEIQMLKDPQRGWAWTRALLGLAADEIYICGEAAAIDLVKDIANSCGEELQVKRYERKTTLTIEREALGDLSNVQPGDCIVCFNKNDIFNVSLELEKKGYECAVIYGSLPPGAKLAQAKKFNDPNHPCKILVATDAIGMGLNLSIRRVIFYSITKLVVNERGEKEMDTISTSQALQIGGRAGRYKTQFSEGFVTAFKTEDLKILETIMAKPVEPLTKAGLQPTKDQVKLFAYTLPNATLSNLIDIFRSECMVDNSAYFMCDTVGFQFLSDRIQHLPLDLEARYEFCSAPIDRKQPFVCTMFLKFAKHYSENDPLTVKELCKAVGWPSSPPQNIQDLVRQEAVFDVLDLYLWLSYKFPRHFPDVQDVRHIQRELDESIQQGVFNIIHLLKVKENAENLEEKERNNKQLSKSMRRFVHAWHSAKPESKDSGETGSKLGQGKLTDALLAQGFLTPKMLKTLREEWKVLENQPSTSKGSSKIKTRKNKKIIML